MNLTTGFHANIPDYDYHNNLDALSSHGAMELLYSPYSFYKKYVEKSTIKKESKALDDGSKIHAAILEPHRLKVKPDTDGRTKGGKEQKKLFTDSLKPSEIAISTDERLSFDKMVESVKNHKIANDLLFDSIGANELVGFVKGDVNYRIKADRLIDGKIIDVKSTSARNMRSFANDCINYQYLFQACFYQQVVAKIEQKTIREFIIVAINKEDPFEIDCFRLPQIAVDSQKKKLHKAFSLYRSCLLNKTWPRKNEELTELELPNWFYNQAEDL